MPNPNERPTVMVRKLARGWFECAHMQSIIDDPSSTTDQKLEARRLQLEAGKMLERNTDLPRKGCWKGRYVKKADRREVVQQDNGLGELLNKEFGSTQ